MKEEEVLEETLNRWLNSTVSVVAGPAYIRGQLRLKQDGGYFISFDHVEDREVFTVMVNFQLADVKSADHRFIFL